MISRKIILLLLVVGVFIVLPALFGLINLGFKLAVIGLAIYGGYRVRRFSCLLLYPRMD